MLESAKTCINFLGLGKGDLHFFASDYLRSDDGYLGLTRKQI